MAVPLACLLAVGLRRAGLRGLLWLIEARGLANRSEGLGWPGPVDKSEGFRWAGLAQGPSIKVRGLGGWAGPGPVDKSEGLGAGLAQGQPIEVRGFGVSGPGPAGPPSLANPHIRDRWHSLQELASQW